MRHFQEFLTTILNFSSSYYTTVYIKEFPKKVKDFSFLAKNYLITSLVVQRWCF